MVKINPQPGPPPPYDMSDQDAPTLLEQLAVAGNTAELQAALGAPVYADARDEARLKTLLKEAVEKRKTGHLRSLPVALGAAEFIREYGSALAMDAVQIRAAITNKLMELANCGEPKYELKALELLGKHSDIGLFTERSEVTINYKNPEALEDAIKERVKRLLNAEVVEVKTLAMDLDEELGIAGEDIVDAEFEPASMERKGDERASEQTVAVLDDHEQVDETPEE
jgi:hypothetical protein